MNYFKKSIVIVLFFLFTINVSFSQTWWGAFYIDPNTGITGGSYNYGSQKSAQNVALRSCRNKHKGRANNCQYAGAFYNSCAAIYWSPVNKKWRWAWDGVNAKRAQQRALNACIKEGGKSCRLSLRVCTTRFL